jgi:penicillin-insensitive murein endopeptidase
VIRPWLLALSLLLSTSSSAASRCYGTPSHGRLEQAVALPSSGANFESYSLWGELAGRTYVHSRLAELVLSSYYQLYQQDPSRRFVYGETGRKTGGPFKPHRTHQNGLSVDFFVPVTQAGQAAELPRSLLNRYGYDIEFDARGRYRDYQIDFAAIALHLQSLWQLGQQRGIGIKSVIIEPAFIPLLLNTPAGKNLGQRIAFFPRRPWVRHDEHYHVDFSLPCLPMAASQ